MTKSRWVSQPNKFSLIFTPGVDENVDDEKINLLKISTN